MAAAVLATAASVGGLRVLAAAARRATSRCGEAPSDDDPSRTSRLKVAPRGEGRSHRADFSSTRRWKPLFRSEPGLRVLWDGSTADVSQRGDLFRRPESRVGGQNVRCSSPVRGYLGPPNEVAYESMPGGHGAVVNRRGRVQFKEGVIADTHGTGSRARRSGREISPPIPGWRVTGREHPGLSSRSTVKPSTRRWRARWARSQAACYESSTWMGRGGQALAQR